MRDFIDSEFDEQRHRASAARVAQAAADFRAMVTEADERHRQEVSERVAEASYAFSEECIRREYAALGVEPPPGELVSVSLLLRAGWVMTEDGHGNRSLHHPGWNYPARREGDGQQT